MTKPKSFITNIREDFIRKLMELKEHKVECFLNDGSSFSGTFHAYNSNTGEYYFIVQPDKVHIISHINCLKIVFQC